MASSEPRWPPPQRHASAFSFWRSPGILLVALGLLLPMCSGRDGKDACDDPMRFETMMLNGPPKASYGPGDRVEFKCRLGYKRIVPLVPTTAVCQPDNTWAPPLQEACTGLGGCDDLPTFASMKLKGNPAPHYTPGNTVEYECLPGYKRLVPVLPTSAVCQPDNTWTPLQEACTRKSCPQLAEPQNAQVFFTHGTFQFGSQAHYVCNEGYNLIGVDILYCNVSGNNVEWSDSPPQCEMVRCNYPVLENGRLVSGHEKQYHYKAKVVFECLEGFDLQGSSTVFCGSNNNWEPKMPKCIKGTKDIFFLLVCF
ncbi:Membrane cofactor protein [Myotis davidii]|uniref:Membrane cofactor protein n=1 Tax=Myotis davidii TaxID=225400 RepID=L5LU13_MYODS|nr:Membrane cofactor protein [Myotis davidii]